MTMWVDDTDATALAQRLRVGPRELVQAIGGPWVVVERFPEHEMEQTGTLFVGRAGPSVSILVGDGIDPEVTVGMAVGEWQGVHALLWTLADPRRDLVVPAASAPARDTDDLLADLAAAVEEAARAKAPTLVVCRYCGRLVAPEHAFDEEHCHSCASRLLGVVY